MDSTEQRVYVVMIDEQRDWPDSVWTTAAAARARALEYLAQRFDGPCRLDEGPPCLPLGVLAQWSANETVAVTVWDLTVNPSRAQTTSARLSDVQRQARPDEETIEIRCVPALVSDRRCPDTDQLVPVPPHLLGEEAFLCETCNAYANEYLNSKREKYW